MTETSPRRLKGHKATATCCIASRDRPGLVLTTGEEVKSFDVQQASSWKPLENYEYNKDEINQIACNYKSSFLAAADDGGDVKPNFMQFDEWFTSFQKHKRKPNLKCSSCAFVRSVISGGLDSKLVIWDFSKGRPYKIVDFGLHDGNNGGSGGQCFNPAFIHAIVVPDIDMLNKTDKICVIARGDGAVDVINIETELAVIKSISSKIPQKGSQSRSTNKSSKTDAENPDQNGRTRLHLDYSLGGHTASVSCVAFSMFGERGKFIISGGNDKSIKVWDWSRYFDAEQTSSSSDILQSNISLSKKVNWLCTTPTESENLIVCDTTKVVKVYSVS
ncbi:Guanine nucleotide-binding protein, beta subunit [Trema orientale]|uniref:Guanine nucleotide-binding protein, beta subunit n=1 Tax=Trema orientale TaxID=63057 RepID=A0A2P5ENY8_TREOI|nr:Guanine nucleotide-binding protein, beta subunit [Trema orientale]